MKQFAIDGVVPVIPTPFLRDGSIDWPAFGNLLEFAVEGRVCAVYLPAYASEFYKLTDFERMELVHRAIEVLNGRLPVVAQVNHVSSSYIAEMAMECERAGASAISLAVPRVFDLPEIDLLRHFDRILRKITLPVVIQDFNPGRGTVSAAFAKSLHAQHGNFHYLKLEEAMLAVKVRSIAEATSHEVGVIDGWGGTYMLELIDAGICGVMPGLGVSDLLQQIWNYARSGDDDAAYGLFKEVLPQITFSLQNMEFFHHAEKSLLKARGVLVSTAVRDATMTVDSINRRHIDFLNNRIVKLVESLKAGVESESATSRELA